MTQDLNSRIHESYFSDYNKFGDACGIPSGSLCTPPADETLDMCIRLVDEEWLAETVVALKAYRHAPSLENFAEVADGIVDTIYVLCQLARVLGVPLDEVWEEVHSANMRKVGADGKVLRRADGKILKPEGWTAPDVWQVCYKIWEKKSLAGTGLAQTQQSKGV